MVVNRANSGVTVADMERTVGMPALALDPVGRAALRAGRQRGPHGHRDVPEREDHQPTSTSWPTGSSGRPKPAPVAKAGFRVLPAGQGGRARLSPRSGPAQRRVSATGRSSWCRPATPPAASRGARPVRTSTCSTPRRYWRLTRTVAHGADPIGVCPSVADRVHDRDEHLGRAVEQAIRLRARVEVDRPDDAVGRHLERDLVGHLVDPVRGPLVVGHVRQRIVAGQDEDEVVRIDRLEPGRRRQRRATVDRRPADVRRWRSARAC